MSVHHYPAGKCPAPGSAAAALLEPCVEDVVFAILRRRRRAPAMALQKAIDNLDEAQRALVAYRDSDHILMAIGEQRFAAGLTARAERIRDVSLHVASLRASHAIYDLPPTSVLEAQWPEMTIQQRHDLIAQVIDCVFVTRGQGNLDQRVVACPAGTAPPGLRRNGHDRRPLRQYKLRREWITADPVLGHAPRWSTVRLERELTTFVGDRDGWPSREDFQDAGRGRLHRQVLVYGGDAFWASHFGLPLTGLAFGSWTDESLRTALQHYLRDKTVFPTDGQLRADGQALLAEAIHHHGGFHRWLAEFALPRATPSRPRAPRSWTIERISAELATFCRHRDTFPSAQEFMDAGRGALINAIGKHGGANWWAHQFGLARIHPLGPAKQDHPIPGRLFPITDVPPSAGERGST